MEKNHKFYLSLEFNILNYNLMLTIDFFSTKEPKKNIIFTLQKVLTYDCNKIPKKHSNSILKSQKIF
jgi:hypothetical protein